MNLSIVAIDTAGGTMPNAGQDNRIGLGSAAAAYLEGGIASAFTAEGAETESIVRIDLAPGDTSDDRIVNLGRINARVAEAVAGSVGRGARPLLLGGTCTSLVGMIAGLQQAFGATARIGLLWLDAHGDFNTPRTTLTGMLGGMPVAVAAGLCFPEWRDGAGQLVPLATNRIVMVDVRNLDQAEEALIRATDVEIARFGPDFAIGPVIAAIDRLASEVDHLYLHVDADILDASLQPNHPTAEPGGPGLDTVQQVLAHAFATGKVCAFGVVSVNPTGPEGPISLANGTTLLVKGVRYWSAGGEHAV
jgi:arginase